MSFRIGQGWDTHQLVEGYELVLGGEKIPFNKGSKGHSDGDVIFHSLADALLGASSLGDIGKYFPSSEEKWKNKESSYFLSYVYNLIKDNYMIYNVDCTVILQQPHISSYIPNMIENISNILQIEINRISIKATTTDKLGFIGRGEGISASSVVLLGVKKA